MLFSSATFLFVFLPVVLLFYFLPLFKTQPQKEITKKNAVLCLASLVFYAWGEPVYILLMLISIYFNYNIGLDLAALGRHPKQRRQIFIAAVVFNLLVLGFFKYYPFAVDNLNHLFRLEIRAAQISLPIGISFLHVPDPLLCDRRLPRQMHRTKKPVVVCNVHHHVPATHRGSDCTVRRY